MSALSTPRAVVERATPHLSVGVKAGVTILQSALVIAVLGYARPGRQGQGGNVAAQAADAATYAVLGVAQATVTGGANDGDVVVPVKPGIYNFANSAGVDAITRADVGRSCYVVDDQTVARTSGAGIRCVAGVIHDIDGDGVWVKVEPSAGGRRRTVILPFFINETDTLAGTSAELVSPVAGNIIAMSVVVQKAVTTGGDVTANVGVTPVAGLTCTIPDGAAKGAIVSDTPTLGDATTAVAPGSRIQIVPGAPFNTAGAISGFIEIAE